jgi:hypothetical protein
LEVGLLGAAQAAPFCLYYPDTCEAVLGSPHKVFLTGLRMQEVPQQATLAVVNSLAVGDNKTDRCNRELQGRTLVTGYGKPGPYDSRPGWLLLVVGARPYVPRHRDANSRAAVGLLCEVLPEIASWLASLLAGEMDPSETVL